MSPTASASCSAERPVSAIHNRVFAALPVAVDIRAQIHALLQQQPEAPDIHWIPAANYHITLAFLGDLSGQQLAALCAALNAAKPLPAVTIRLRAIARFPDSSGHIIAAGVHKSAELSRLHKAVLEAAVAAEIHLQRKQFVPHITLGRLGKSPRHELPGTLSLAHLEAFKVTELALYRGIRETLADQQTHYHYRAMATFALELQGKNPPIPGL